MTTLLLRVATLESVETTIATNLDPTGDPPEFALSTVGAASPGPWAAGAWKGVWSGYSTVAVTPLIGSAGVLIITAGAVYDVWVRVTLGGELAVWVVDQLVAR